MTLTLVNVKWPGGVMDEDDPELALVNSWLASEDVQEGNPYHDAMGRFTDAAGAMAADKDAGFGAGSGHKGLPPRATMS